MNTSPGYDNATRGPNIVATNAVFISLATVAVALRLFTRYKIVSDIGPEDYMLVGAWVSVPPALSKYSGSNSPRLLP